MNRHNQLQLVVWRSILPFLSSTAPFTRTVSRPLSSASEKLAKRPKLTLRESIGIVKARDARKQAQRESKLEASSSSIPSFSDMIALHRLPPLARAEPEIVQVNIGRLCNLTCRHCHVESGPTRQENMDEKTVDRIIALLESSARAPAPAAHSSGDPGTPQSTGPQGITTVDITGGAPELNPHFRKLVKAARGLGLHVIDRCNLSVLFQPGQEDTARFLAEHQVHVLASLPSTNELAVERQRGRGSWASSLQGLRLLNSLGYGRDPSLRLDLIFNPPGLEARLPPPQAELDQTYRNDLLKNHGIAFNNVLTITNMPVKRFADDLAKSGQLEPYMNMLALSFSPSVLTKLMCKNTISIGWDGSLYDCDFNQQMGMAMPSMAGEGAKRDIWGVTAFTGPGWAGRPIATSKVCYGCTAGAGSSCSGALL